MAVFIAVCPHCETKLKVKNPLAVGRKVRCLKCNEKFRLQEPADERGAPVVSNDSFVFEDDFEDSAVSLADPFDVDDYGEDEPDALPIPRAPVKKKKKKKKPQDDSLPPRDDAEPPSAKKADPKMALIIAGASIGGIVLLGGLLFLGRGLIAPKAVAAPLEFVEFEKKLLKFRCECPKGWEQTWGGGKGGRPSWARFESGDMYIKIRESQAGSLVAGPAGREDVPEEFAPAAVAHEFRQQFIADTMSNYQEQPPIAFRTGFADARRSEFTASSTFGFKLKGYRTTLLTGQDQFDVVCRCSASQFEMMKSAFEDVIESIARGRMR